MVTGGFSNGVFSLLIDDRELSLLLIAVYEKITNKVLSHNVNDIFE